MSSVRSSQITRQPQMLGLTAPSWRGSAPRRHTHEAAEQRAEQFAELGGARQDTIEALRAKLTSEKPRRTAPLINLSS